MPKLIMIRGPAGTGKSAVSKILQKKLGNKTALIEMDKLYYDVLQNDTNHKMVLECAVKMADVFLKKEYNVILEGVFTVPFDKKKEKLEHDKLFKLAKKHKTKLNIFFLDVSLDKAIERAAKRHSAKLSKKKIAKLHSKTRTRRHDCEKVIETTNLSPAQVANRILKQIET